MEEEVEMKDVWVAIDTKTNKLVGFGDRSTADKAKNSHAILSGNPVKTRLLRVGMTIKE